MSNIDIQSVPSITGGFCYDFRSTHYHIQNEVRDWCSEQFGNLCIENDRWDWISTFGNTRYWFQNEQDAALFLLRWS